MLVGQNETGHTGNAARAGMSIARGDVVFVGLAGQKGRDHLGIKPCGPGNVGQGGGVADVAAFGEISLSGEVRGVANLSQRTNEASRLGHKIIIDSTSGQLKKALTQALAQSDQSQ